ncbi:MAG TPA: serine/threonine-protein kinase [Polyangia bacterium]|nr:serine/threonine-protein kinase [Polyangia bacterium]HVZ85330.1 serine/threonine-protein kinase [Polyangia bacterium]
MTRDDGLRAVRGADDSAAPDDPAGRADGGEAFKRGRDTVLAVSPRVTGRADGAAAGSAVAGGAFAMPSLRAEERRLLGLVDGRLSIGRLAHLASLSEETTARYLQSLYARGILVPVEPQEITIRGQSGVPFFRLGAYEIAARIGQGGMGSVYVCRRTGAAGFRRLFTLKVLREDSGQQEAALRTFMREIRVGGLLDHPNVQSVVDVGMYKDQPFLILDYVEGTDLEELTAVGGALAPEVVVTILLDVLRGLQRAHDLADEHGTRLGLIHSDVSPPNILVGLDGVARVADFGNVRFTDLGETDQPDPMALGKPAYMAPEQFRNERLDGRVDVFAVGAVMWGALTGRDLFAAEDYDQIVRNVMGKEIQPPSSFGANPCLDDVCMRALSRERKWRYASADEMAAELLSVAARNGLVAPPTRVANHVQRTLGEMLAERRRRIEVAFHGTAAPAVPTPIAATGEMGSVPTVAGSKIAKTVVLPPRTGRAPDIGPQVADDERAERDPKDERDDGRERARARAERDRTREESDEDAPLNVRGMLDRFRSALDRRILLWFLIGLALATLVGLIAVTPHKHSSHAPAAATPAPAATP